MGERLEPKTIRLPPDVWAQVEAWAQREERSVSQQITYVLRRALEQAHAQPPTEDAWAYTPEHRARVAEAMAQIRAGNVLRLTEDELRARIGLPAAAEDTDDGDGA